MLYIFSITTIFDHFLQHFVVKTEYPENKNVDLLAFLFMKKDPKSNFLVKTQ